MLETLDYIIRIGSTSTFLYFELYVLVYFCDILYLKITPGRYDLHFAMSKTTVKLLILLYRVLNEEQRNRTFLL